MKLLPCPFCGNDKNIGIANEKHDHGGGYYIACPVCDASTGLRFACGEDPAPLLIEQWNRRAALASKPPSGEQKPVSHVGLSTFAWGVTRMGDNPKAVLVSFRSEPTDDDLRALHEALRPASGRVVHADSAQPEQVAQDRFDEVLLPFLALMRRELHANTGKGDRPGWLQMDANTALLEVYYHLSKLQKAVRSNDGPGIQEYAADVANMSMMVLDVCGGIDPARARDEGGERS